MNISLTADLKAFIDSRVSAGSYSSSSEYVRDLLRKDEQQAQEERFKALIEEGLSSESAGEWSDLRARFLAESGVPPARQRKSA